jgi:hypothetical protein
VLGTGCVCVHFVKVLLMSSHGFLLLGIEVGADLD